MKAAFAGKNAMAGGGFSLLELLVSCAIIGIMMMVLLSTAGYSLSLWRGTEQRIAVDREGRNGLALMADDLANMIVLPGALQPRFGHWNNGVFMEFPVARPPSYQSSSTTNVGDICYVRYRMVADSENLNGNTFTIQRNQVDSAATFVALETNQAPSPGPYELLVTNVIQLDVNTYDRGGTLTANPGAVSLVNLSLGMADIQEVENLKQGIPMPENKTTKQFFSINGFVPRTP